MNRPSLSIVSRHHASHHPATAQWGGETVEAALFVIPFFIICFLIIDSSIAMFNQNVINQAARSGARNGSLYWVDPIDDPTLARDTHPTEYVHVRTDMITTAVDYYLDNVLINFGEDTATQKITPGSTEAWLDVVNGLVAVQLSFPHAFLGLDRFLPIGDLSVNADMRQHTEYDL